MIMNNQSEVKKQFFHRQEAVSKPEEFICTQEVNIPNKAIKIDPTNFTTAVHELTLLVVALTRFGKLVLPLFPYKPAKKIPPKVKKKKHKKS